MQQRSRRGGRWYAVALVELVAMGVMFSLTRAAPLIGDDHDEADDECERAERLAVRDRRRAPRHRGSTDPVERLAQ